MRVVVYRGVPVMAMIRLPTRSSDGKANLNLGGVGVGIDIGSGRTIGAVSGNRPIQRHPDTLESLLGLEIPGWNELLVLAAHCQSLCGLGYLGVDLVLDARRGPLVLELNARPGLTVQLANGRGLRRRLDQVDALASIPAAPNCALRWPESLPASRLLPNRIRTPGQRRLAAWLEPPES